MELVVDLSSTLTLVKFHNTVNAITHCQESIQRREMINLHHTGDFRTPTWIRSACLISRIASLDGYLRKVAKIGKT